MIALFWNAFSIWTLCLASIHRKKALYKRYKPTALFFTIIWSWFEKWSCGRRGTRAWYLASLPQTASPYNQIVSRLTALIDGESVCCWDESNPIQVTCRSLAEMCVSEQLCCQIRECLIPLRGMRFTFVTLSHESRASGPIVWSHYLILRLMEWCGVPKPEGVMWERILLHKHALLLSARDQTDRVSLSPPHLWSLFKSFSLAFPVCLLFSLSLVLLQLFPSSPFKWNSWRAFFFCWWREMKVKLCWQDLGPNVDVMEKII